MYQIDLNPEALLGVGVDGCRGGWLAAFLLRDGPFFAVFPELEPLLERLPWAGHDPGSGPALNHGPRLLVDMPVGLPYEEIPVRACDAEARRLLGPRRASVFSPPCREALDQPDHARACEVNRRITGRGLSIQSWNIAPRIHELDRAFRAGRAHADRVLECHPELFFAALLGAPAQWPKRTPQGRTERVLALTRLCPDAKDRIKKSLQEFGPAAAWDDCADALVLALAAGHTPLTRLGMDPLTAKIPRDRAGLPMTIHTPVPMGAAV